jgi:hypothetical protein
LPSALASSSTSIVAPTSASRSAKAFLSIDPKRAAFSRRSRRD